MHGGAGHARQRLERSHPDQAGPHHDGEPAAARAPDLVDRQFVVPAPNTLFVADFTYVAMTGGFASTAFVIDAFAGTIVGWETSWSKESAFVERAVHQAASLRFRQGNPLAGNVIHHSDAGSQGGFNRSSQHLDRGGADGQASGVDEGVDGQVGDESPGAPSFRREVERAFWLEVATGVTSEEAAIAVGASPAVGSRWFRQRGGMASIDLAPLSGRYLSFREREEIAIARAQGAGVRDIARRLGRDPSTVSRELRRNAATRGGKLDYRASVAQWKAELLAQRPKTAKLVTNERLREYVQERLSGQTRRPDGTAVAGPRQDRGVAGTSRTAATAGG